MLAIVGGAGRYELPGLEITHRTRDSTPFGDPSGEILRGRMGSNEVLFLARHGAGHRLLPHEVNYRANVFALKQAGATMLLGFSAVGSLAIELKPGDLAMPEQYFDWTGGQRQRTFFGEGVAADVSTAKPVSAALVDAVQAAARCDLQVHRGLTYACVEGPRLGTQAESRSTGPSPLRTSTAWECHACPDLKLSNRPVRTRTPGGGAGVPPMMEAPYADSSSDYVTPIRPPVAGLSSAVDQRHQAPQSIIKHHLGNPLNLSRLSGFEIQHADFVD